jgi:prephenate dehydrogenase
MKFGIIGYGSFGKLLSSVLSAYGDVLVYVRDREAKPDLEGANFVSFEEAAACKVVILAVGLGSLDEASSRLAGCVGKDTIVVDVSSVKTKPVEILEKNLGGKCRILYTHPLFGPQTVQTGSVAGKSIAVCPFDFKGKDKILHFLEDKLQLKVIEMSAEDHDKEMAWVHALTFFVGRGLMKLDPPASPLTTGYYQKLLDLVELEHKHSIELFNTVERGNPFAAEIRDKFMEELRSIDEEIRN